MANPMATAQPHDPAQPQPVIQHTAGEPVPTVGTVGRPRLFPGLHRQATPAPTPPPHDPTEAQTTAARDLQANLATLMEAQAEAHAQVSETLSALRGLVKLLTDAQRPGEQLSLALSAAAPYTLDTRGYQRSYLLLATAGSVIFDIPGIGPITRALSADWNRVTYPNGTRIGLASGAANVNALLWLTNDNINV